MGKRARAGLAIALGVTVIPNTITPVQQEVVQATSILKTTGTAQGITKDSATIEVGFGALQIYSSIDSMYEGKLPADTYQALDGRFYHDSTDDSTIYLLKKGEDPNKIYSDSVKAVRDSTGSIELDSNGGFSLGKINVPDNVRSLGLWVSMAPKGNGRVKLDRYYIEYTFTHDKTGQKIKSTKMTYYPEERLADGSIQSGSKGSEAKALVFAKTSNATSTTSQDIQYSPRVYLQNDTTGPLKHTVIMLNSKNAIVKEVEATVPEKGKLMVPFGGMKVNTGDTYKFRLKSIPSGGSQLEYDTSTITLQFLKKDGVMTGSYLKTGGIADLNAGTDSNTFRIRLKSASNQTSQNWKGVMQTFKVTDNYTGASYDLQYKGITGLSLQYDASKYKTQAGYMASQEYKNFMSTYYPTYNSGDGKVLMKGRGTLNTLIKGPGTYYYAIVPTNQVDGNKKTLTVGYYITVKANEDMSTRIESIEKIFIDATGKQASKKGIKEGEITFDWQGSENRTYELTPPEIGVQLVGEGGEKFTFVMVDQNGKEVNRVSTEVKGQQKGTVKFPNKLILKGDGPYLYTIRQVQTPGSKVIYDDAVLKLRITKTGDKFNMVMERSTQSSGVASNTFCNRIATAQSQPVVTVSIPTLQDGAKERIYLSKVINKDEAQNTGVYAEVTNKVKGNYSQYVQKGQKYLVQSANEEYSFIFTINEQGIPVKISGDGAIDARTGNIELKPRNQGTAKLATEITVMVNGLVWANQDIYINGARKTTNHEGKVTVNYTKNDANMGTIGLNNYDGQVIPLGSSKIEVKSTMNKITINIEDSNKQPYANKAVYVDGKEMKTDDKGQITVTCMKEASTGCVIQTKKDGRTYPVPGSANRAYITLSANDTGNMGFTIAPTTGHKLLVKIDGVPAKERTIWYKGKETKTDKDGYLNYYYDTGDPIGTIGLEKGKEKSFNEGIKEYNFITKAPTQQTTAPVMLNRILIKIDGVIAKERAIWVDGQEVKTDKDGYIKVTYITKEQENGQIGLTKDKTVTFDKTGKEHNIVTTTTPKVDNDAIKTSRILIKANGEIQKERKMYLDGKEVMTNKEGYLTVTFAYKNPKGTIGLTKDMAIPIDKNIKEYNFEGGITVPALSYPELTIKVNGATAKNQRVYVQGKEMMTNDAGKVKFTYQGEPSIQIGLTKTDTKSYTMPASEVNITAQNEPKQPPATPAKQMSKVLITQGGQPLRNQVLILDGKEYKLDGEGYLVIEYTNAEKVKTGYLKGDQSTKVQVDLSSKEATVYVNTAIATSQITVYVDNQIYKNGVIYLNGKKTNTDSEGRIKCMFGGKEATTQKLGLSENDCIDIRQGMQRADFTTNPGITNKDVKETTIEYIITGKDGKNDASMLDLKPDFGEISLKPDKSGYIWKGKITGQQAINFQKTTDEAIIRGIIKLPCTGVVKMGLAAIPNEKPQNYAITLDNPTYTVENGKAILNISTGEASASGMYTIQVIGSTEGVKRLQVNAGSKIREKFILDKEGITTINILSPKNELLATKDISIKIAEVKAPTSLTNPAEPAKPSNPDIPANSAGYPKTGLSLPKAKEVESNKFEYDFKLTNTGDGAGAISATLHEVEDKDWSVKKITNKQGEELSKEEYKVEGTKITIPNVEAKGEANVTVGINYNDKGIEALSQNEGIQVQSEGSTTMMTASLFEAHQDYVKKQSKAKQQTPATATKPEGTETQTSQTTNPTTQTNPATQAVKQEKEKPKNDDEGVITIVKDDGSKEVKTTTEKEIESDATVESIKVIPKPENVEVESAPVIDKEENPVGYHTGININRNYLYAGVMGFLSLLGITFIHKAKKKDDTFTFH